jgi:hypothetical protein
MDEFLCMTVCSMPSEKEADFSARLSRFWTHMLRNQPAEFEKVYAETTRFELHAGRHARKYAVQPEVVSLLETELSRARLDYEPVDRDDIYSKYEVVAPDWMQIEH